MDAKNNRKRGAEEAAYVQNSRRQSQTVPANVHAEAANAATKEDDTRRIIERVVGAVTAAVEHFEPFRHLQLDAIFPPDVYSAMLSSMPEAADYRRMSGRSKYTRTNDGGGTRTKIDLFPEYIRHLPPEKRPIWNAVGRALCSPEVREAFRHRLAPGLKKRFGAGFAAVGMYPFPLLTRDVPD
jgi:hypothetical protein